MSTLGVSSILLAGTDTGEKSYLSSNIMKRGSARDALVEGAMQGFTTRLPALSVYRNVESALASLPPPTPNLRERVVLDNIAPDVRFSRLNGLSSPTIIAVGSVRGWSDRERSCFAEAGFTVAGLGERVLRTETACTVAVVLALEKLGII
jgi:RsmE family RNA methyltransferase